MRGGLPANWDSELPKFPADAKGMATRDASSKTMNAIAGRLPSFMGGSADLNPSTKTALTGYGDMGFGSDCGRNVHFGVREHWLTTARLGLRF